MEDGYRIRRAERTELRRLHALMMTVFRGLENPDVFAVESIGEEWFDSVLDHGGFGVAAESPEGSLAGFLMVDLPGRTEANLGLDIGLPEAELDFVAVMDTAAVLPEHRGHGLEKRMVRWAETQLQPEYRWLTCTVSPANPASLRSLEACGYRIVCTKEKYGGHLRHVMLKERRG